jgi:glycosyltransferase involved in cell wall biosynthesis
VHILARPEPELLEPISGATLHSYVPSEVVSFSLRNVGRDLSEGTIVALIEKEQFDIVHFHMALDLSLGFLDKFQDLKVPYVVSLHDYFYICPRITMIDAFSQVCRDVDIAKCNFCIGKLDQIDLLRRIANKAKMPLPRIRSTAAEERIKSMRNFLAGARTLLSVSTRTAEIYKAAVPEAQIVVEQIGSESVNGVSDKTPSNKIRVVALSTLSRHKGADLLQIFLSRVNRQDMEFHFYGRAVEGYGRKLRRFGLQCHGPYKPSEIPSIMAASDVGLVLSIWEDNGPQVAMEFINHKTPVLGTKRGGIPDIVSPRNGHLFEPDRAEDIEGAIRWLKEITVDEIHRISAGICRLKTPDEHARRISALYDDALGRNHQRQGDPFSKSSGALHLETTDR